MQIGGNESNLRNLKHPHEDWWKDEKPKHAWYQIDQKKKKIPWMMKKRQSVVVL